MDKKDLLKEIETAAAQNAITRREMDDAYNRGLKNSGSPLVLEEGEDVAFGRKIGIGEVLYFIGGSIVFIGICVFVFQHWHELGVGSKMLATFGSAVLAYIIGVLLNKNVKAGPLGQAFFFISALVLPIGLGVILDNAGGDFSSASGETAMAIICLAVYLASYYLFRRKIFTIFNIIFGTWLFFAATSWIVGSVGSTWDAHFFEYRALIAGILYLSLGYIFTQSPMRALTGWLYAAGSIAVLGSTLALGGYSPNENGFWETFFAVLVFGIIFLSVHLKSKVLLIFGSLFLMGYVLKITFEYFSQSLSWAVALIISGLALIAIGYFAYYLNRKYLKT